MTHNSSGWPRRALFDGWGTAAVTRIAPAGNPRIPGCIVASLAKVGGG